MEMVLPIRNKCQSLVMVALLFCVGCEASSLTPTEPHGFSVFENKILTRIFGPKRK
jgi:hypothetical protein